MQTSRDLNMNHPRSNRVNGMGVGMGLALVVGFFLTGCAPGSLPCKTAKCEEYIDAGTAAAGGAGGGMGGGMGGSGGGPKCEKYTSTEDVEKELIVKSCGKVGACHAGAPPFPPKLDTPGMIAAALIDVAPKFNMICKSSEKLVDKADWMKSWMLKKSDPKSGDMVQCAGSKDGGKRMPFAEAVLSQADYDCLQWYVSEIVK